MKFKNLPVMFICVIMSTLVQCMVKMGLSPRKLCDTLSFTNLLVQTNHTDNPPGSVPKPINTAQSLELSHITRYHARGIITTTVMSLGVETMVLISSILYVRK